LKFAEGILENGVAEVGGEVAERVEDEGALVHAGMREGESVGGEDEVVKEDEVEVDEAGAVAGFVGAVSAEGAFDIQEDGHEGLRREGGLDFDGGVEVIRLVGWAADGGGGAEGGLAEGRGGRKGGDGGDGGGDVGALVLEV
jgi:hypothetical protein